MVCKNRKRRRSDSRDSSVELSACRGRKGRGNDASDVSPSRSPSQSPNPEPISHRKGRRHCQRTVRTPPSSNAASPVICARGRRRSGSVSRGASRSPNGQPNQRSCSRSRSRDCSNGRQKKSKIVGGARRKARKSRKCSSSKKRKSRRCQTRKKRRCRSRSRKRKKVERKKKNKKCASRIKRPMNAFILFYTGAWDAEVANGCPPESVPEFGSLCGERWRAMSKRQKKPYVDLACKEMKRYHAMKKKVMRK